MVDMKVAWMAVQSVDKLADWMVEYLVAPKVASTAAPMVDWWAGSMVGYSVAN